MIDKSFRLFTMYDIFKIEYKIKHYTRGCLADGAITVVTPIKFFFF